jgi:hypothetical protein
MSAVQASPAAANTYSMKETSFSLRSVNKHASDGELRHTSCQSSSSKPTARHFLLKELKNRIKSLIFSKQNQGVNDFQKLGF